MSLVNHLWKKVLVSIFWIQYFFAIELNIIKILILELLTFRIWKLKNV